MRTARYCLLAVHVPPQPVDCRKVPEPLRPERRPELVTVTPLKLPTVRAAPLALTRAGDALGDDPAAGHDHRAGRGAAAADGSNHPRAVEIAAATAATAVRAARRGLSASGLLRRAGFSVSIARGVARDPDSDFSSLPMLPPALPDCAKPALAPNAADINRREQSDPDRALKAAFCINRCLQFRECNRSTASRRADVYCFDAVHVPVQPSDRRNVPEPLRPEKRPELLQLRPETDPPDVVEPLGLTCPELNSPEILPPLIDEPLACCCRSPGIGQPTRRRNCRRHRHRRRFSAKRGAVRRARAWACCAVRASRSQPRAASRAIPTAISRHCRCCRRRCRIARSCVVPNATDINRQSRPILIER